MAAKKPTPRPAPSKTAKTTKTAKTAKSTSSARVSKPSRPAKAVPGGVDAFMRALEHPLKAEIEAVRQIMLGLDAAITEEVKWNAPSFRTDDFFATLHLRARDTVQVVLHRGVKTSTLKTPPKLPDPQGLVRILAPDRVLVTLGKGDALRAALPAFAVVVRAWLRGG